VSDELRAADLEAVRQQLGREPLIPFSVVARCSTGHPFVIRNKPIDPEGNPFPTIYWLTCPDAVKLVSQLESEGWIASLNNRYDVDPEFREAVDEAHGAYAAEREEMLPGAGGGGGVGGTRRKIKCLHAHYAYHLAGGDDVVGRWTAERVEPVHPSEPGGRVAAIDQGTNSTRLLVLEPREEDVPREIARDMVITRLGQGVDEAGRLDPAAIDRAVTAIARFSLRTEALNAERIRIGATSAVRDSENRDEFLSRVRDVTGIDPVVIDGEREAALSFLGGTRGLDPVDGPFLLIDIGGGSTEFVFGRAPTIVDHAISTQMGSVRLTERVRPSDPPTEDDLRAFGALIEPRLDEVERTVPVGDARILVAVAGTATTLQACALGIERYDPDLIHRSTLTLADAERTLRELATMTNEERAAIPVMPKGRAEVIVAGAEILVNAMRRFGFEEALVSETDILDGLALELLNVR
jgi:exopolyphosphatase / guanosine-5'-triphosphate,3'-diphosphate pyrophosphatase